MSSIESTSLEKQSRKLQLAFQLTALVVVVLVARIRWMLLYQQELGDESESIVASRMVSAGLSLYDEVFQTHGPLQYLPGVIGENIFDLGYRGNRLLMVPLEATGFFLVYWFLRANLRVLAISMTGLLAALFFVYLPNLYVGYYTYQYMAGLLVLIGLAGAVLPALLSRVDLNRQCEILGLSALACLPFLAITYLPATLALISAFVFAKGRISRTNFFTIGGTVVLNLAWLLIAGSLRGFVAIHLYFNLRIAPGIGEVNQSLIKTATNPLRYFTKDLFHVLLLLLVAFAFRILRQRFGSKLAPTLLLVSGICLLTFRGFENELQSLPFYFGLGATLTILIGSLDFGQFSLASFCLVLVLLVAHEGALRNSTPLLSISRPAERLLESTYFAEVAREYTSEDETVLSWTYSNDNYVLSDRLPSLPTFWLLGNSWTYLQDPILGVGEEPCTALSREKPKVIYLNKSGGSLFGSWETFGSCIDEFIGANYADLEGDVYLRNDLDPQRAIEIFDDATNN